MRGVLRGYAWRRQRAIIQKYAIIIAATPRTIRYSMHLPRCFGRNRKLSFRLDLAFTEAWTGMAPAIAIARMLLFRGTNIGFARYRNVTRIVSRRRYVHRDDAPLIQIFTQR